MNFFNLKASAIFPDDNFTRFHLNRILWNVNLGLIRPCLFEDYSWRHVTTKLFPSRDKWDGLALVFCSVPSVTIVIRLFFHRRLSIVRVTPPIVARHPLKVIGVKCARGKRTSDDGASTIHSAEARSATPDSDDATINMAR